MAPTMIPAIDPRHLANPGERIVYEKLRAQLPEEWAVRYHFPYVHREPGSGIVRDGEVDFIVSAPGRGLLFLEVKSSPGFCCEEGRWYAVDEQGRREERRNPFEQVQTLKHHVVEKLAMRLGYRAKRDFPGVYGHAVVYPLGRAKGGLPLSQDPVVMITSDDMEGLYGRLLKAFDDWALGHTEVVYTPGTHRLVVDLLRENADFAPVVTAELEPEEETIEQLTRLQFGLFRQLLQIDRILVRGAAGTGKTMLAVWAAAAMSAGGRRVLYLCYNKSLSEWLACVHADTGVRFRHFHHYCHEVVAGAGRPFVIGADPQVFWRETCAELAADVLGEDDPRIDRYDAIFVDEGQDFHPSWWWTIQLSLADPDRGGLYIFLDPRQRGVYGMATGHPEPQITWNLAENCRNTRLIARYSSSVIGQEPECFPLAPEGTPPSIDPARGERADRTRRVRKLLLELLDSGASPSRIALLTPWGKERPENSLEDLKEVHHLPVVWQNEGIADWLADRAILKSTIKSFKGMEADHVILADLTDVVDEASAQSLSDLYVASSRARHRLHIVPATDAAERKLRGWLDPAPA